MNYMKLQFSFLLLFSSLFGIILSFSLDSHLSKSRKFYLQTLSPSHELHPKEPLAHLRNVAIAMLSGIMLLSNPVLSRGAVGEGDFPDGM